jgi:hypothetical protein
MVDVQNCINLDVPLLSTSWAPDSASIFVSVGEDRGVGNPSGSEEYEGPSSE